MNGLKQHRLLIAVMTCARFAHKAQAVRDTWAKTAAANGVDVKFFRGRLGANEVCRHEDTVCLDIGDGYYDLPKKVRAMFAWALAQGYTRVTKTDDDVYINIAQLKSLCFQHDYMGRFRGPSGCYPAWYASGFIYTLSPKAMQALIQAPESKDWAEDRVTGNALAHAGIQGHSYAGVEVFAPMTPPVLPERLFQLNTKEAAAFCEFNVDQMCQMHNYRSLAPAPHLNRPQPTPVVLIKPTTAQLTLPPNDLHIIAEKEKRQLRESI